MDDRERGGLELDARTAAALIADGAQVLDVRSAAEYATGHIDESTHIPIERLANEYRQRLDKRKRIVCVCASGERSLRAAEALRRAGYEVWSLRGGLDAWRKDGREL